jgi:hypothetical protein
MKPFRLIKHARGPAKQGKEFCRRNFRSSKLGSASIIQLIYCSSGLVAAPHHDTEWLQRLQLEGMAMLS